MHEGDWVVCKSLFNRFDEQARGYIKYFSEVNQDLVFVKIVNMELTTATYVNIDRITRDDSRHPEDIKALIDWALADGDRDYFNYLVKRLEVVTDG